MAEKVRLKIEYLPIEALTPYDKNTRIHTDEDVKYIENSIDNFEMSDPIGIWGENNTVVEGHGRLIACKKLGYKEVPCIRLDHLTDEQRRAYGMAHNKTAEKSFWDYTLVDEEIEAITGIDMADFGFEFFDEEEDEEPKENERVRTDKAYNLELSDLERVEGFYQMPIIENDNYIPKDLIGFNYVLTSDKYESGVHFYIDDYQFERVWNEPDKYIEKIQQFDCALSPDFSLYMDMPMAMKIWNVYRSRLIGQIMQDNGIKVIPTISWAEKETFEFCFDGIRKNAIVSISTVGVKNSPEAMKIFKDGCDAMIERLKPKAIVLYGGMIDYDFGNIKIITFENAVTERMKASKE